MIKLERYCIKKDLMGCSFYVYYNRNHIGGGPIFIDYIFSKREFLEEHKDCKSVLEVCSGPGFIGWYLYKTLNMDSAHFLDIHKHFSSNILCDKNVYKVIVINVKFVDFQRVHGVLCANRQTTGNVSRKTKGGNPKTSRCIYRVILNTN